MTPTNRWKLISVVLAGCMSYSWWHGGVATRSAAAPASHGRLKGPIHVSAAALGISTDELVRELLAAKTVEELTPLVERFGTVGDDAAIDGVMPLVSDPRDGVPALIVGAFGTIGSEHAVDVLIDLTKDTREAVRGAAVDALGTAGNPRAETVLIELAKKNDEVRDRAIAALGEVGTDKAVPALAMIAAHPDDHGANAIHALAHMPLASAHAQLVKLVDSPSVQVAATAIADLTDIDAPLLAKLTAIVKSGNDRELVAPALGAIAKAGDAGFTTLREVALDGALDIRIVAMNELAKLETPQALDTLKTILENEDGRAADAAASAIASVDSDEAREVLISAALSERAEGSRIVEYLMQQTGPEVEQALLEIAKSEGKNRWDAVEHLVKQGNAEALALAVAQAGGGDDEQRIAAMQALSSAGTQPALDGLLDAVEHSGELKARAIAIVADGHADDPGVAKLLREAVQSHDADEAGAAAAALATVGTPEARDALIDALGNPDASVAMRAATSLTKFRMSDEVTSALESAVRSHPELKPQVMNQLVAAGTPLGMQLAKEALMGGSTNDAYRALSALEQAGTPAAFDLIAQGTRAQDANVRAEALSSIGSTGDKRAIDVVASALHDADSGVRSSAARTLGSLASPKARDLLINMSRSADTDDRIAAVSSLRRYDDADATRRLTELMRDPNGSISYTAIDALADRSDAQPAIRAYLNDPSISRDLRRQAAQIMTYRGYDDSNLQDLLSDY